MITSPANPLVKQIKRLRQRKYRDAEGLFYVEGLRVVAAALQADPAAVQQLVWCDELLASPFGRALVESAACPTAEVSAAVFRAFSERDNPTGLGALVRSRTPALDELVLPADALVVALVDVADPGNLGTVLRTADAVGAHAVVLVGSTVDAAHPTALKASMGAWFAVPTAQTADLASLLVWVKRRGLRLAATSARGTVDYRTADYRRPLLLLMGSEREGLPPEALQVADQTIAIPMRGVSSSLNLAVATGLLLYQAADFPAAARS